MRRSTASALPDWNQTPVRLKMVLATSGHTSSRQRMKRRYLRAMVPTMKKEVMTSRMAADWKGITSGSTDMSTMA